MSAIAGAGVILATAAGESAPILDAATRAPVHDARLVRPVAYVVLSPVCELLDALTLLSLRQHVAVLATLALGYLLWRTVRARRRAATAVRELVLAAAALLVFVAVYAVGAVVPRPMAALRLRDPDDVAIDFHSHTAYSHDGRRGFDAAANRRWHAAAGFDVAYITDHRSVAGALEALARDGQRGRDTPVLLPGLESRDGPEHILVLGVDTAKPYDRTAEWHDPPQTLRVTPPQLLILSIPGNLLHVPQHELTGVARLAAVELSDGAPRGIGVTQSDRGEILAFARRLGLALVAGSDNHGWGQTAVGWSVMRIPGWRVLAPMQLDSAIRATIVSGRTSAARVYVRASPDPGSSTAALVLTVPLVIWRMLVDLSWPERVSWLVWIVAAVSIASVPSSRTARDTTPRAARRNPDIT